MSRTRGSYSRPEQFNEAVKFYASERGQVGARQIHKHLAEVFWDEAVVDKTVARWMPDIKTRVTLEDFSWRWPRLPEGVPVEASRLLMDAKLEFESGIDDLLVFERGRDDYREVDVESRYYTFSNRMARWTYYCHQLDPTWWPSSNERYINQLLNMARQLSEAEMARDLNLSSSFIGDEEMTKTILAYRPHLNTDASNRFYDLLLQRRFVDEEIGRDSVIYTFVERDRLLNPTVEDGADNDWWVRRYRADEAWSEEFLEKVARGFKGAYSLSQWKQRIRDPRAPL